MKTRTEPSPAEQAALMPTRGLGNVTRLYSVNDVEIRAQGGDSTLVEFYGHASVTNKPYEMYGGPDRGGWNETVDRGAFTKTLGETPDVAFLVNHAGMTLARTKAGTLTLAEDSIGLEVKATLDTRVSVVNDLTILMQSRNLDEMSFAFRTIRQKWLDALGEEVPWWDMSGVDRHMVELSLHKGDVSVVNYGANPFTDASMPSARAFATAMRELRAGVPLSNVALATLHQVLDLISGADDNLDDAQEILAGLMNVPNPDEPEPDAEDLRAKPEIVQARYADLRTLLDKRQPISI